MTNKQNKISQFNRSGNVHYRVEQRDNGETGLMLQVDFDRAPEPDHSFVADFVEVSKTEADVLIVFGKIDLPSGKKLRNKVELYFSFTPFVHQLWRSSRRLHAALANSMEQRGDVAKDSSGISSETEKVMTLVTNNVLIVQASGQCLLDFFLISAKDLWVKTRKGDPLNVEGLVRVFINEHLLLEFMNRCDEIAQGLVKDLDITFSEDDDEVMESIAL